MHSEIVQNEPGKKWVLPFIATLIGMMALQMSSLGFSPLLPYIQKQFDMSYTQVGIFTGIYGILAVVLSVPAGLTAKRLGEKGVLIAGLFVAALGLAILSRAANFNAAFLGRGVWIGGYRFAFVSVLTALAVTCPPSLRGRSMGILGAMSSLASVIGAPFGGSIGQAFGWRNGILAFAGTAILGAVIVATFYKKPTLQPAYADVRSPAKPLETGVRARSPFRMPLVWALAVLVGLIGMPSFSVTFFAPSAAKTIFKLDAVSASWIISGGYLAAIFLNLGVGFLMDRFNKWIVMGGLAGLMVPACIAMATQNLMLFRISTAVTLAFGFTATNQVYGLAGDVLRGRQTGNVMGVVSLGAGLCGYLGPQMLGALRDWTGGFTAGWYTMAGVAAATVGEVLLLSQMNSLSDDYNSQGSKLVVRSPAT